MGTTILLHDINNLLDLALDLTNVELENQNALYFGANLKINGFSVRFRKSKITPTKTGQFVVVWEKNSANINQPYSYTTSPDYLIIYSESKDNKGVFVFPKEVLLKNKILSSSNQKGKMGFRVYPSWEKASSPQALKTQNWQCKYFIDLNTKEAKELIISSFNLK